MLNSKHSCMPKVDTFTFDEFTIVIQYAKYLLQFVEAERKRRKLKYFDPVKRMWKVNYPTEAPSWEK